MYRVRAEYFDRKLVIKAARKLVQAKRPGRQRADG
jgi:hypothetical protein